MVLRNRYSNEFYRRKTDIDIEFSEQNTLICDFFRKLTRCWIVAIINKSPIFENCRFHRAHRQAIWQVVSPRNLDSYPVRFPYDCELFWMFTSVLGKFNEFLVRVIFVILNQIPRMYRYCFVPNTPDLILGFQIHLLQTQLQSAKHVEQVAGMYPRYYVRVTLSSALI